MIEKGTLFSISCGEYEDHHVLEFVVTLLTFNPESELEEFLSLHEQETDYYSFVEHLMSKGLVLLLPWTELHLGKYGGECIPRVLYGEHTVGRK